MKKMDASQRQSLSDFLAGVIVGAALTLFVASIRGSRARNGIAWDDAWANSSAPLDLEQYKKGGKSDAEASSGSEGGNAQD